MSRGVSVQWGLCAGASLSGGFLSRGVSVGGSLSGGLCPVGSLSRGVLCPAGSLLGVSVWGVSAREIPPTVTSRQCASYWNAFLFVDVFLVKTNM